MHIPYRYWLTRVGALMTCRQIGKLFSIVKYLEIGFMMGQLGYKLGPRVSKREDPFDIVGREAGDREVLYLEFGVYQGQSTRYWSTLLTHPASKLHGFDSFEGLPKA